MNPSKIIRAAMSECLWATVSATEYQALPLGMSRTMTHHGAGNLRWGRENKPSVYFSNSLSSEQYVCYCSNKRSTVMFLDSVGGIYRVSPSHISLIGFRIPPRGLASEMWTSIGWVVSYVVGFSYGSGRGSYRDLGFHIYDLGWWSGAKIAGDNKLFHQM
jgi:hypothetical protein